MMGKINVKAQTAMELAVFGAILIFVVGVIIRQALNAGYQQNQSLKAMRQAMSTSYRYSAGLTGLGGNSGTASHQTANSLFIEDRLTADSAKYAAVDRTPFIVGASASYSRNLFLPVDAGEDFNLPVYDVFINGQHFPFTTAKFREVDLAQGAPGIEWEPNCVMETGQCETECVQTNCLDCCTAAECNPVPGTYVTTTGQIGQCETTCVQTNCTDCCTAAECNPVPGTYRKVHGCAKMYTILYNHPGFPEWCDGEPGGRLCPVILCQDICHPDFCAAAGACDAGSTVSYSANLTADERFDLNRDGTPDVPAAERRDFAWQWYLVMGVDVGIELRPIFTGISTPPDPPPVITLLKGAGIVLEHSECKKDCDDPQNTSVDIADGDRKLEQIMVDTKVAPLPTGVITRFTVLDFQDGDIDFTRGDSDTGPDPGLQRNTKMYSFLRDGTYLLLEEGRLYSPADPGQYIRTAQKKDQVDIIERTIQLSNNTGRFCDGSTPVGTTTGIWTEEIPNPVKACQNCSSGANIQKTCMDQTTKNIIVRSRILDRRGRKWVTPTGGDDYVDFTVPGVP